MFTARYALNPYIKQIRIVFKGLTLNPILFMVHFLLVLICGLELYFLSVEYDY
jgi:hypothetical protein